MEEEEAEDDDDEEAGGDEKPAEMMKLGIIEFHQVLKGR